MTSRAAMVLAASVAAIANASATMAGQERRFRPLPDEVPAADTPDRASIERPSPFFDESTADLGVRIDGIEQDSVVEFSVSERWARIGERDVRGKLIWDFNHYRARKVEDVLVEPYWKRALSRQQRRARESRQRRAK